VVAYFQPSLGYYPPSPLPSRCMPPPQHAQFCHPLAPVFFSFLLCDHPPPSVTVCGVIAPDAPDLAPAFQSVGRLRFPPLRQELFPPRCTVAIALRLRPFHPEPFPVPGSGFPSRSFPRAFLYEIHNPVQRLSWAPPQTLPLYPGCFLPSSSSRPLPNTLNFATHWPLFFSFFALRPSSSLCNRLWRHRPRRARSRPRLPIGWAAEVFPAPARAFSPSLYGCHCPATPSFSP